MLYDDRSRRLLVLEHHCIGSHQCRAWTDSSQHHLELVLLWHRWYVIIQADSILSIRLIRLIRLGL